MTAAARSRHFLKEKYGYDVSEDEKFYLTIHVAKVIKQSMAV